MRIISGKFRGKRLKAPASLDTRPTTDFAKEALFNILQHRVDLTQLKVLDLFAGIGGMSLEFLSREAEYVMAVEQERLAANFIEKTAKDLKFDNFKITETDVFKVIKRTCREPFDLVFADPPFSFELSDYEKIHTMVIENEWLKEDGLLILEHFKKLDLSALPHFRGTRNYGNLNFSFFSSIEEEY